MNKAVKYGLGALAMVASGASMAQATGVDVTAATGGLQQVADAVNDIGPLMLVAVAAGIVYKWVTAFLI